MAPFYDLVTTRAYPRVDRHMAMRICGKGDPDALGAADWTRFAVELTVGERYLRTTAGEVVAAVESETEPALRALEAEFGRKDFLRSAVVPAIRSASRRVAQSLKKR